MSHYRQGDLLFMRSPEVPADAERVGPLLRHGELMLVIAEGEITGHAHAIQGGQAVSAFDAAGSSTVDYLVVSGEGACLRHEEHDPLALPPGTFRVLRQREYDPASIMGAHLSRAFD